MRAPHTKQWRETVEPFRVAGLKGLNDGAFKFVNLRVIASNGMGWDHVSVSLANRCPIWEEMEQVRDLFFEPDEWVIQYSAPREKHINIHPYCLHMWRPQHAPLPIPPVECV